MAKVTKMTAQTTPTSTTTQTVTTDQPRGRGRGRPMSPKTLALIAKSGMTVAEYKAAMAQKKAETNARRASGEVKRGRKPGSKNKQTPTPKQTQPKRQKAATHTAVKAQTIKAQETRGVQPIITQASRLPKEFTEIVNIVFFPCCKYTTMVNADIKNTVLLCTCGTIAKI